MDPADSQRLLSAQNAALSRHEQSIQIAHQNVTSLAQSVESLVRQMSSLSASGDATASASATATAAAGGSYACDPEPFDGDLNRCRGFLLQCRLVFAQRSAQFHSDQAKIYYIIGLLRGRALAWAQASSRSRSDSTTLEDFLRRFEQIFDRPNFAGCAGDRLFTIRQGARSVAEYTVEFEILAEESGFNEPALLVAFRRGLNEPVRDALVAGAHPGDLAGMIDRAIELDNFQRERRRERPSRPALLRSLGRQRFSPPHASPPPR